VLEIEKTGGEGGIRTLGTGVSPYNGLANRRIRPLCHLSGVRIFSLPRLKMRALTASIIYIYVQPSLTGHSQHFQPYGVCRTLWGANASSEWLKRASDNRRIAATASRYGGSL
jgi:hypothetical protein